MVVFDDVDVDKAATVAASGKFRNAGQVCVSPDPFLRPREGLREVREDVHRDRVGMKLGNGLDGTVEMGPLANGRRVAAIDDS